MTRNTIIDRLKESDRAVSPVIGVILMVAITVILAAVIGTFVLDLGQSAGKSAPSASLTVSADTGANTISIEHKGGDALEAQNSRVLIQNESGSGSAAYNTTDDPASFSVGDTVTLDLANANTTSSTWSKMTASDGSSITLSEGFQYNVQLVDTESQRVIFETTITA